MKMNSNTTFHIIDTTIHIINTTFHIIHTKLHITDACNKLTLKTFVCAPHSGLWPQIFVEVPKHAVLRNQNL